VYSARLANGMEVSHGRTARYWVHRLRSTTQQRPTRHRNRASPAGLTRTAPAVYRRTEPESAAGHASADDDLLTAAEVAALLRMTPAWVYAETRRNRIPHMRLGRYFRYRRSTIDDWMSQLEAGTDLAGRLPSSQPKLGRLPTGVSSSRGR